MSALPKVFPDGAVAASENSTATQDVWVEYDETNDAVSVSPESVSKGTKVCFKTSKGTLKVVFLSPTGKETDTLTDTDECYLTVGGSYHFKCFFTGLDGKTDSPKNGGVIIVAPTRP